MTPRITWFDGLLIVAFVLFVVAAILYAGWVHGNGDVAGALGLAVFALAGLFTPPRRAV